MPRPWSLAPLLLAAFGCGSPPQEVAPVPARVTVRPDRSFHFEIRTPPTAQLLLAAAGVKATKNKVRGAGNVAGPNSRLGADGKGKASFNHSAAPGPP